MVEAHRPRRDAQAARGLRANSTPRKPPPATILKTFSPRPSISNWPRSSGPRTYAVLETLSDADLDQPGPGVHAQLLPHDRRDLHDAGHPLADARRPMGHHPPETRKAGAVLIQACAHRLASIKPIVALAAQRRQRVAVAARPRKPIEPNSASRAAAALLSPLAALTIGTARRQRRANARRYTLPPLARLMRDVLKRPALPVAHSNTRPTS